MVVAPGEWITYTHATSEVTRLVVMVADETGYKRCHVTDQDHDTKITQDKAITIRNFTSVDDVMRILNRSYEADLRTKCHMTTLFVNFQIALPTIKYL